MIHSGVYNNLHTLDLRNHNNVSTGLLQYTSLHTLSCDNFNEIASNIPNSLTRLSTSVYTSNDHPIESLQSLTNLTTLNITINDSLHDYDNCRVLYDTLNKFHQLQRLYICIQDRYTGNWYNQTTSNSTHNLGNLHILTQLIELQLSCQITE